MIKIANSIVNPPGNIIRISVIGCGGTGSLFLSILSRMAYALKNLKRLELVVTVFDIDIIDEINPCRQAFSPFEAGMLKSDAYVSRINRFWDYRWTSITENPLLDNTYAQDRLKDCRNIIITATDTRQSRIALEDLIRNSNSKYRTELKTHYWIDMGNSKHTGNVILTDLEKLPTVCDYYKKHKDRDKNEPSCSIAQSLNSQNILINQHMATVGAQLLWDVLTKKQIDWRGAFINSETLNIKKIKV